MRRILALAWMAIVGPILAAAPAGEVSGRALMSEVCSPTVSPAVAVLEPMGAAPAGAVPSAADVALVNQRGLQFVPRVQAIQLGQALRFTNEDAETHNVHVLSPGNEFNATMAPGQPREFRPSRAGVVRLACDVHSHMRGYVVVSASPYVRVCSANGNFRFHNVPDGRYTLTLWHEMGEPLKREVEVGGGQALALGDLALAGPARKALAPGQAEPARPWPDVVDRVGLKLASALEAATRPGGYKQARRLAEDAYFVEFEASDMETAVRSHLGLARKSLLERQFRSVTQALREVADGKLSPGAALDTTRPLMLALTKAAEELNRKGVTDATQARPIGSGAEAAPPSPHDGADRTALLVALQAGFARVAAQADRGEADDAVSALSTVYFEEFEPLERFVAVHRPQDVRPLEAHFSQVRGAIGTGLKGPELSGKLAGLHRDVREALERSAAGTAGSFASGFAASLVTIVREGVEVILLLTMLLTLAAKTGQARASRAIAWGVALALFASGATAFALNRMVASAQGRSREMLEGAVMLAAAGALFYVSYWLISQSESKRWMGFLKRQAGRGSAVGFRGFLALGATAFLAVYREGAETALMYQALIGSQNGSGPGLSGVAGGFGLGLVVLAAAACAIRFTSVKLPLRAFFQVTGGLLFAMAVVFAGHGVYELQASEALKTTPLDTIGGGLPWLGVYPNVQSLSVQGVLLAGAAAALVMLFAVGQGEPRPKPARVAFSMKPPAGVGA